MDLQEVLNKLEEAIEEKNWDSVQEVYEQGMEHQIMVNSSTLCSYI